MGKVVVYGDVGDGGQGGGTGRRRELLGKQWDVSAVTGLSHFCHDVVGFFMGFTVLWAFAAIFARGCFCFWGSKKKAFGPLGETQGAGADGRKMSKT